MTKLYKLTDQNHETHNHTKWGEGVTHTASGEGELCGPGFLHAYTDPLLAVFLNKIHANFQNPVLWEAEGDIAKSDHGLKVGCTTLTTLRVIPMPEVTTVQRVALGILCAMEVYKEPRFTRWACGWLDGSDRTGAVRWSSWAVEAARGAGWAASWSGEVRGAEAVVTTSAWVAREAAESALQDIDLIALAHKAIEVR